MYSSQHLLFTSYLPTTYPLPTHYLPIHHLVLPCNIKTRSIHIKGSGTYRQLHTRFIPITSSPSILMTRNANNQQNTFTRTHTHTHTHTQHKKETIPVWGCVVSERQSRDI